MYYCLFFLLLGYFEMLENDSDTPKKDNRGRKPKEKTGRTMFIPAHLLDYVLAMMAVDKANENRQAKQ
jgi:hypothetical protein